MPGQSWRTTMSKAKRKTMTKAKPKTASKVKRPPMKKVKPPTIRKVKSIPDGYHTATPYLVIRGAAAAIDYYKKAFGAKELVRMDGPGGKIGHAEMKIGDSPIMLAD